jgi:acyl carrier protein
VVSDQIRAIWSRELALDSFSDDDDFFALGGHSLVMARIQTAIVAELGVEVPMDELFRQSTVAKISDHLQRTVAAP